MKNNVAVRNDCILKKVFSVLLCNTLMENFMVFYFGEKGFFFRLMKIKSTISHCEILYVILLLYVLLIIVSKTTSCMTQVSYNTQMKQIDLIVSLLE